MVNKSETTSAELWEIKDHICRVCFSRVLMRRFADGEKLFRCAGCGIEATGTSASVLCCCGQKMRTGASAGLQCQVATSPTPEFPAQIVAVQV